MPRNPSGPMPGSPSRCYPSIVHVLDETVQNVGSCERMLGLEAGSREDLGPSHFVTTAGQISRTLKTRARAFPLF